MEGLGVAASFIAVADLSAKVAALCLQYYSAVSNARHDIQLLQVHIKGLETILRNAGRVVQSTDRDKLPLASELIDSRKDLEREIEQLKDKLEPGSTTKLMSRFGARALKWPFSRGEVEAIVKRLERYQSNISSGFQIDQTNLLLSIHKGIGDLSIQESANKTPLHKTYTAIPFAQDPDFISRPDLQAWMQDQFESPTRRIALVGLGGFGKSQLAIEFAYTNRETWPDRSVFWVHGGTKNTFEESYRSIADILDLPRRHEPDVNPLALVRDWLQRTDIAPWIMILDNADDINTFFDKADPDVLASYLPKVGLGKIIVTSRSLTAAEKLVGTHKAILEVPKMGGKEALQLFRAKLESPCEDEDSATALVHALDLVPLAVTQAAAYINRRAPRVSITSYLKRFRQGGKQRSSLLVYDGGDLQRYEGISNSVVITWQVTFEQICVERRTAAKLLALLSFFQPHNIPETILSGYHQIPMNQDEQGDDDEQNLEDDIDVLRAYSLVDRSTTIGHLEMHSLVQFCTQRWLSARGTAAAWEGLFLRQLEHLFPDAYVENWPVCQVLLSHMDSVLITEPCDSSDAAVWANLVLKTSQYLDAVGEYSKAVEAAEQTVRVRKRILGADDPATLTAMDNLIVYYRGQGRPVDEILQLGLQVFEGLKLKLGPAHLATLRSMNHLAIAYRWNGQELEAERLLKQLLSMVEDDCMSGNASKPEKEFILSCKTDLAAVYRRQGRLSDAEKLQTEAINAMKKAWGPKSPLSLRGMTYLVDIFCEQRRWSDAEELCGHVLQTRQDDLGPEHPHTLITMGILAYIYDGQLRWSEGERMRMQALEGQKIKLGPAHPFTMQTMSSQAHAYAAQRRFKEAEEMYMELIKLRTAELGPEHPSTLSSRYKFALILSHLGRFEEAISVVEDVARAELVVFGPDHERTRASFSTLQRWQPRKIDNETGSV